MNEDMSYRNAFIDDLYCKNYVILKGFAIQHFKNDSRFAPYIEDCIQETFMKATANYEKLLTHESPTAWLLHVCYNELCSFPRKYARYRKHFAGMAQIDVESAASDSDDLDRWIRQNDAIESIEMLYQALTPIEKNVFNDYYVDEKSMKETAFKHKTTENAVHSAAKRIRKKAKRLIKKDFMFFFPRGHFSLFQHYIR